MTQQTPVARARKRRVAITVLSGLIVAFGINVATQSPWGWLFGAMAAALAWQITAPKA